MKLGYCATCEMYTLDGMFDFATNQRGKVEFLQDGSTIVRLGSGGKALPDTVPWAKVQAAHCVVCGGELVIQDLAECPHITVPKPEYWKVYDADPPGDPPRRLCLLCGQRQVGETQYINWADM